MRVRTSSTQTGHPELIGLIGDRIRGSGPVSFAWFMEQALYHPMFGYYASDRVQIGRHGDYFTNVSVGPVFGRLVASQFHEMWLNLGRPHVFWIVEQGAHHGEFAADVLEAIREMSPGFLSAIRYCIIEPFGILRQRQTQHLAKFNPQTVWSDSVQTLQPFIGVFFCNELVDSFPVHLIVSQHRSETESASGLNDARDAPWLEKYVGLEDDQFVLIERPIGGAKLRAATQALPMRPGGYSTEINLHALDWIERIGPKLTHGYMLVLDYGYTREQFYAADRTVGTLQIRSRHRSIASPFHRIGQADITAHVEWTSLAERAEQRGFHIAGFTDQHHFLTGIISGRPEVIGQNCRQRSGELQTLLHPEMLGRAFQVLALSKKVDPAPGLSGLKFVQNARDALGLCP